MATTIYQWLTVAPNFQLSNGPDLAGGNPDGLAITATVGGQAYLAGWTNHGSFDNQAGRFVGNSGLPADDDFIISKTVGDQTELSLAALNDGRYVATYTDYAADPDGDLHGRLLKADGTPFANDFTIANHAFAEHHSNVVGLINGGFVVTFKAEGADNEIRAVVYGADGGIVADPRVNWQTNADGPSVAALKGGGFVVAWESDTVLNGQEVRFRRFDASGAALDGDDISGVLIDTGGSVNKDVHVTALADGGFVVAYTEAGALANGLDIAVRVYNADGTPRSAHIVVNMDTLSGDQDKPSVTSLSNGGFAVGWSSGTTSQIQAFDSAGNPLGSNSLLGSQQVEFEIAGLHGARVATIAHSTSADASGHSVRSGVFELVRNTVGDASDETLTGDALTDYLYGGEGNDILEGKGGDADYLLGGDGNDTASYSSAPTAVVANMNNPLVNTSEAHGDVYGGIENLTGSAFDDQLTGDFGANLLRGGLGNDILDGVAGNDHLDGGEGEDTASFGFNLGQTVMQDFHFRILASGPDGTDTLTSIEHLKFLDATLDVTDDGNALFDTLYYFSRNTDVFFAGANALEHFNANGQHEGRDPNAFFDTSGYLAINKDVAASGMNPLEHYHQTGWKEGRDPGANFDTKLYLIHNPDVAAAGVDPLAHFLQFGQAEGRASWAAIGDTIANGFDAEYYLLHNPDVAAAGIDPRAHFQTNGWHEGRNPNAYFDTAGYLSHYGDVAAAGVNPLDHYMANGWQEGRDASAAFDTAGYLAANPDVAAAHVNPLQHYLQFGIYECRSIGGDGMWG